MEDIKTLLKAHRIRFEEDCSLAKHSSFRIGGKTFGLFPKTEEELIFLLQTLPNCGITPVIVGRGSNLVFPDEGLDAVIFTVQMKEITAKKPYLIAASGATLSALASAATDVSLSGLEFAKGIPGSVGGGIFMNAGAFGEELSTVCVSSRYYDRRENRIVELCGEEQDFSYRSSIYQSHPEWVILSGTFLLQAGSREDIQSKINSLARKRRKSQPLDFPCAGSVFKRPEGFYAGRLIEDCGWKGKSVGGAQVSEKHAGFIVNTGNATAQDVKSLTQAIIKDVKEKTGIGLECEIRFF